MSKIEIPIEFQTNDVIENSKLPSSKDLKFIIKTLHQIIPDYKISISLFSAALHYLEPFHYRECCLNSNNLITAVSPIPHKELTAISEKLHKLCSEGGICFREYIEVSKYEEFDYFVLRVDMVPIMAVKFVPMILYNLIVKDNVVRISYLISELLPYCVDISREESIEFAAFNQFKKYKILTNCENDNISIMATSLMTVLLLYRNSTIIDDGFLHL